MVQVLAGLLALLVSHSTAGALVPVSPQSSFARARFHVGRPDLYVTTPGSSGNGRTLAVHGGPPWIVAGLARIGGELVRVFGDSVYAVDVNDGTVARIPRAGGPRRIFAFGANSAPQDVLVLDQRAFVTLRHETALRHVDLATGNVRASVDLAPLGRPGETLALGTLIRDGLTLFVQVRLDGVWAHGDEFDSRGVLAVVDPVNEVLLDADPLEPGVQGIALAGAPPHLKMQIVAETRTLFVSTTDGFLDGRGGIEMVDLDTWRSVGFALHEKVIADLGGFVMTSPEGGYFVFHTDLLASTHLKPFTIAGGPPPGPEMVVFFDVVDQLAYDPREERVYLPGRYGSVDPVVHVFDTRTNEPVGSGVIAMPDVPFDVAVPPR